MLIGTTRQTCRKLVQGAPHFSNDNQTWMVPEESLKSVKHTPEQPQYDPISHQISC